jgi:hypothetical protein
MAQLGHMLLGWRDCISREEIAKYIVNSLNFDARTEEPGAAKTLLLFQTSRQRTWLVATAERLYCILDDVRKPGPHINWSMPRSKVMKDDQVALEIRPHDRTAGTGLVDFGTEHPRWLYTRDFFERGDVVSGIQELLKTAMS